MNSEAGNRRIDTLLVDIGQVLVGLNVQGALLKILPFTPLSPVEIRARLAKHPIIVEYETGRITTQEFHRRFCAVAELNLPLANFVEAWETIFDFAGGETGRFLSVGLFRRLRESYRMVALSNTNPLHFDHLRRLFPLVHEFDDYVLSHEIGSVKPDEAIFRAALAKAERSADQVLFIDDLEENVLAAKRLGIDAVVFQGEARLRQDLADRALLD